MIECHKYDVQRPTVFGNDNITLKYMLLEADNVYNFVKSIDILPQIYIFLNIKLNVIFYGNLPNFVTEAIIFVMDFL